MTCQYLKEQIVNKLKGIYQAFKKMFDFFFLSMFYCQADIQCFSPV